MKKLLLIFPSFYPAYKSGGPVRSATNLIKQLKNKYAFDVFTADRDLGETAAFNNVNIDSWDNSYFGARVYYTSVARCSLLNLRKLFADSYYEKIYLNSFFNYKFSIKFVILYKLGIIKCDSLVLAPRGELTNGAMNIKSLKKKCYLSFFKFLGLNNVVTFHFTSIHEKNESLAFLGNSKYILAPNMHGELPSYRVKNKSKDKLNILFLSRISPKKNLLLVIEALAKIHSGEINFTIAGELDDKIYWNKCKARLKYLSENIKVNVIGAINRVRVSEELFKCHLFILPTLNENYGHAIVEAMMHSNIVLISDQTPWTDVQYNGGSVVCEQDLDKYIQEIENILLLDKIEFNQRTNNVYRYCDEILQRNVASINKIFE